MIDSSVALNWVMPDERNIGAERLLETVSVSGAAVPQLFKVEVGNALLMGVRRKRVSADFPGEALELLGALPLRWDTDGASRAWTTCFNLAASHGLTLYDATYLELAMRLGSPLATLDGKLAQAAKQAGLPPAWPQ